MNRIVKIIFCSAPILFYSCEEQSTAPDDPSSIPMVAQVYPGAPHDSLFVYAFTNTLDAYFSTTAKCGADSTRYEIDYELHQDTIIVSVTDTSHANCRCICSYLINVQFIGLYRSHYVVRCRIGNRQGYVDPAYLQNVFRHP